MVLTTTHDNLRNRLLRKFCRMRSCFNRCYWELCLYRSVAFLLTKTNRGIFICCAIETLVAIQCHVFLLSLWNQHPGVNITILKWYPSSAVGVLLNVIHHRAQQAQKHEKSHMAHFYCSRCLWFTLTIQTISSYGSWDIAKYEVSVYHLSWKFDPECFVVILWHTTNKKCLNYLHFWYAFLV